MKCSIFLLLFCFTMYGMETESSGSESTKLNPGTKQVSWHEDVKDKKEGKQEAPDPIEMTKISAVPKENLPSFNTRAALDDRALTGQVDEDPAFIALMRKRSLNQAIATEKYCSTCWKNNKDSWYCCPFIGCWEDIVKYCCCDCCLKVPDNWKIVYIEKR